MNTLDRVDKVCTLVSSTPGQMFDSRKKFQKIVYLLQIAGENFGYDFSYYLDKGMFSGILEEDVKIAEGKGLLLENDNGKKGIEVHYCGKLPQKALSQRTNQLVTILAGEDKRTLHVLSDINFLRQSMYKKNELEQKVRELNPYQNPSFISRAFQLYEELVNYFPLATNSV